MEAARKGFPSERFEELIGSENGHVFRIMEVCGTHTMSIARYGIRDILPSNVKLVSGPGCPVCVTCNGYIDAAVEIAHQKDVITATFGDMVKVPGSACSLAVARAEGCDIRVVYSPLDCLEIALENPGKRVVFLSVGFETTIPPIALMIINSRKAGISNISVLTGNKTLPAVLEMIVSEKDRLIDGFLYPGHISAITGTALYERIADKYGMPGVIAGFEPMDILQAIYLLLSNIIVGRNVAVNCYERVVKSEGNKKARNVMNQVFEQCDAHWRGIGKVTGSGLKLRQEFSDMDAWRVFNMKEIETLELSGCICGDIIMGRSMPGECDLFGKACTPENPAGPCMVSSEGSCAAYYRYRI